MDYPTAPRTDLIETMHGIAVPDPFRRLESADDPETVAWVAGQNARTRALLDSPLRDRLAARLRELHRVPRMSVPAVRGERIFFTESDGLRAQPILYADHVGADLRVRSIGADLRVSSVGADLRVRPTADTSVGPYNRHVLVDPNLLDADGTTAITVFEPDDSGARVVYGLSRHGSDAQELLIHDVASGAALGDRLLWVKFASIAWWGDGFFYTRYPQPGTLPPEQEQYFCQVWLHRLGDPQAADRLVYHRPDAPEVVFEVKVTSDDRQLVIGSYEGASDHAEIHVIRLPESTGHGSEQTENADAVPLVTSFTSGWHFIDGRDDRLYFRTDAGAPFGRIVRFDLREAEPRAQDVVPESRDTIVDAVVADGRLLVSSLHNASGRLTTWSLDGGGEREIALPGIGSINGLGARWTDARSLATFTSFTTPPTIMACGPDALTPIRQSALPFDPSAYAIEQVWYPSKDGTPISMFLVSRKRRDGRPEGLHYESTSAIDRSAGLQACDSVLLTGYGGFNISLTPAFDPSDFLWLDAGGTIAVANLRGGGEYGDAWHRAGMRERKQNVFDDFIAAAEWLEATGRAAPGRVAIEGGSNGGLLVGACLVQRPDLFGAAICRVPVADMLRYHRFTVGRFWIPEYGCADDAADFTFLRRYSPYHNVIDGAAYPPTLVMTADTDDRVAPGMAKKFAARLQEATTGVTAGPIVLRVETRAGHGAGKPTEKQVDEQADMYSFLFHYLTRTSANEQLRP
jgi:prolyl oligopeptidase